MISVSAATVGRGKYKPSVSPANDCNRFRLIREPMPTEITRMPDSAAISPSMSGSMPVLLWPSDSKISTKMASSRLTKVSSRRAICRASPNADLPSFLKSAIAVFRTMRFSVSGMSRRASVAYETSPIRSPASN